MSTRLEPGPHRPLIDPVILEEAGRNFRIWLERLMGQHEADTSIAWESGEPDDEQQPPAH